MDWPVFSCSSPSLVKKYLSPEIFTALEKKTTPSGYTLAKVIASGLKNPDSRIGIYAGDADSYQTFSQLFDPIIAEYHRFSKRTPHQSDFSVPVLSDLDPDHCFIRSFRVRVARNISGFEFTPHISLTRRQSIEKKIATAFSQIKSRVEGDYISFELLEKDRMQQMKTQGLLFEKGDRFQDAAGINSDFPRCRGVFLSPDRGLRIWVNEEDHLRIICLADHADISGVFKRLSRTLDTLGRHLAFARDPVYGYLASCPTNIGTAMRAGVHIQLRKLSKDRTRLNNLVAKYHLQIRGTTGEKTKVEDAVFDISNQQRLGISEASILKRLHQGLSAIIDAEKNL